MAQPSAKPGLVIQELLPPVEEEVIYLGAAFFDAGIPATVNVTDFALVPTPENFGIAGAIQLPSDVEGSIHTNILPASFGNVQLRGSVVNPADTLTPDPALNGVTAVYSAPGVGNERSVDVTYDGVGAPPPGSGSVVRGVWKGVDMLIFITFSVE